MYALSHGMTLYKNIYYSNQLTNLHVMFDKTRFFDITFNPQSEIA